jgi:hypothetical protein
MNKIVVMVFSKNRAAQLDLTLKTFFKYVDGDDFDVKVLYKADEKHRGSYDILANQYDYAEFIEENNFKQDLLKAIEGYEKILWIVDDCVWVSKFNIKQASDILDYYPNNVGVSFRLGTNTKYCYSMSQRQNIPAFTRKYTGKYQDFLEYDWRTSMADFSYSLEVSSSLYRVSDLREILEGEYKNPHDLEWNMYLSLGKFVYNFPNLVCYEKSVAFCNPVNKVQTVNHNRAGNNFYYSPDDLLIKFEQGYRIDDRPFDGFVSNGCHQEVEFEFYKKVI